MLWKTIIINILNIFKCYKFYPFISQIMQTKSWTFFHRVGIIISTCVWLIAIFVFLKWGIANSAIEAVELEQVKTLVEQNKESQDKINEKVEEKLWVISKDVTTAITKIDMMLNAFKINK